jgi:hypothetical protein
LAWAKRRSVHLVGSLVYTDPWDVASWIWVACTENLIRDPVSPGTPVCEHGAAEHFRSAFAAISVNGA